MSATPWILISVAVLIVLIAVFAFVFRKKGKKCKTDYYTFFVMGITWLPIGILFMIFIPENVMGFIFIVLGATYTAIGLSHRKEWKKTKTCSKEEQNKILLWMIIGVLIFLGLLVYYLLRG